MTDQLQFPRPRTGPMTSPSPRPRLLIPAIVISLCLFSLSGCRAIRRFGDSRQTIAARRLSGQGFQAMNDGRWDIAETLFTDALSVSKSDDRAHWGLAESYWEREERELAIEHMEQAVRLSGGDPKLVQRLGRMYLDVHRIEEAERHSLWALQMKRDSEEVWALRGDCLRAAGDDVEALAAYHRALALRPDYPEVQLRAAEIYRDQQRFDRVLATLGRLQDGMGIDDTPSRVDLLQGIAMRQLGRPVEAQRCFHRAAGKVAREDPHDATVQIEIARTALQTGDAALAQRALAAAAEIDPAAGGQGSLLAELQRQHQRLAAQQSRADSVR